MQVSPAASTNVSVLKADTPRLLELCGTACSLGLGGRPKDSGQFLGPAEHDWGAHYGVTEFISWCKLN